MPKEDQGKPLVTLKVKVPQDVKDRLKRIADHEDKVLSRMLRRVLVDYALSYSSKEVA